MGFSVVVAFSVMLFIIWNIIISFYVIILIVGIIFVIVGFFVLLGWEFNVLEFVIISVAVGLFVDFVVYYGVVYRLVLDVDREGKVIFFLSRMGFVIVMVVLIIFVVGVMMMFFTVLVYI